MSLHFLMSGIFINIIVCKHNLDPLQNSRVTLLLAELLVKLDWRRTSRYRKLCYSILCERKTLFHLVKQKFSTRYLSYGYCLLLKWWSFGNKSGNILRWNFREILQKNCNYKCYNNKIHCPFNINIEEKWNQRNRKFKSTHTY